MILLNIQQQGWIRQEISDNVIVHFPNKIDHNVVNGREIFACKMFNCAFMVGIARAIPDYTAFEKLEIPVKKKIVDDFFSDFIKAKLEKLDIRDVSINKIQLGGNIGRSLTYSVIGNPNKPSSVRFSQIFIVKNAVYTFECWYLDNKDHNHEKDIFFNSISIEIR